MSNQVSDEWIPISEASPDPHIAVEILVDGEERLARMQLKPMMRFHWFDEQGRKCTNWPVTDGGRVTHWRDPYRHRHSDEYMNSIREAGL